MNSTYPKYTQKLYAHKGILNAAAYTNEVDLRCYAPSPAMEPFVDVYFVARWNRPDLPSYFATDIQTRPTVNMFFTAQGASVSGVINGTRSFLINENGIYAGVKFKPGSFRAFYHDLSSLTNQNVAASIIFPDITETFTKNLLGQADDQQLIEVMERSLVQSRPRLDKKAELLMEIIEVIETSNQEYTVSALATKFGHSERTLQRLFQDYAGVGVKWVLMRNRLLVALEQAGTGNKLNWTNVAAELNYSSQSHLINDFKQLIGVSPSEYVKIILGILPSHSNESQVTII